MKGGFSMKKEPLKTPDKIDLIPSYEMSFTDDQNDGGPTPEKRPDHTQTPQRGGRGWVTVLILFGVFTVTFILMLYFFVFKNSIPEDHYTNTDVVYNVDYNGDKAFDDPRDFNTKIDYNQHPNPSIDDFVVENSEGALAKYLLHPDTYKTTMAVTRSNATNALVYLNGSYQILMENGKYVQHNYTAVISQNTYDEFIEPLSRYLKVQNDDGAYVVYYSGSNYSYSLQSSFSWSSILLPLLLIAANIGLIIFLFSRMTKSMGSGGNPMASFTNSIGRKQNGSKVRFRDVAGCDEAKAELMEMVDYFHSVDKYTRLGAKLPHGVLLVGPPGTGKTLLAKAVAGEANIPFYSVSGSDFVEMYVGVGASRVRSLFKTAKQNAPCLIFIDEIDAVGRQRGAGLGGGNDEREQTLNGLLVEMDGFEDNNGIIVMAATNRNDVLDPALTRPGRFDRQITVDLPDKAGREAILKVHARNKKVAEDVNFATIASRTVGFSGADLANIMNDAAILAVRANRNAITILDIDEAIDRAYSGPAKKSHLEPDERRQVAYHEAGHAVIGIFLPYSDKVQKITIIPRGRTGGHVLMTPEKDRFLLTKNQLLARITGFLGGRTSEEIFFGDVSTGASNDIEVATNIARSMVTEYGMSNLGPIQYEKPGGSVFLGRDYGSSQASYSTQIAYEIDQAVRQIVNECHEAAKKLLEEHRADVELIAETLIEHETITADQIDYLLKNKKLPEIDEHKMNEGKKAPKNAQNIVLFPDYNDYYLKIDDLIAKGATSLVIIISSSVGYKITDEGFKSACTKGVSDKKHIALLFITREQAMKISTSAESFGMHLESYAGISTLMITAEPNSFDELQRKYDSVKDETAEAKAEEEKTEATVSSEEKVEVVEEKKDESENKEDSES